MKFIFAMLATVCFSQFFSQKLEKPQLVQKIDTGIVVVTEFNEPALSVDNLAAKIDVANQTPQFPGGQDSLDRYIKMAVESFIYGDTNDVFPWGESVYVAFEIAPDGKASNPIIEMGYNALLDSAALQIVLQMPLWQPATNEAGQAIVSSYRLQFLFDLNLDMDFDFDESEPKKKSSHWVGFEIGTQLNTNDFMSFNPNFQNNEAWQNLPLRSTVVNLNLFAHKFRLFSDYIGLATGYGLSFLNTDYAAAYTLNHDPTSVSLLFDSTQNFKRSTLYGAYLTIPVLFEFTSNSSFKKAFYLNAGVIGGLRLYSHHRQTGTYENGDKFEWITRSKFNLHPLMLDATIRIGYGSIGAFLNYAMLSTFKEGVVVGQYPLRFGLSVNLPQ